MTNKLTAIILITVSLLAFTPVVTWAQDGDVSVERVISISQYGLVYVQDSLTKAPVGDSFEIGIPAAIHPNLRDLQVVGATIAGQENREGDTYYRLLPTSERVIISYVYSGLISGRADGTYIVTSPSTPFFTGINYSSDIFIQLPADAQVPNIPRGFALNGTILVQRGVKTSTDTPQTISLTFTSTDLRLLTGERLTIVYDLDSMLVTIWVKVRNDDYRSITNILLNLPPGLRVVEAGDYSGQIDYGLRGSSVVVNIYPQRFEVQAGWRYEFYVKAMIQESSNLTRLAQNTISLKTFSPLNATIEDFNIEAILPKPLSPASNSYFSEIYRDTPGRVVVRFQKSLVNPYKADTLTFETTSQGVSPIIPQSLVLAILILGAGSFIAYGSVYRAKKAQLEPALDQATAQRLLRGLSELRDILEELDDIAGLRRGDVGKAQMQPSMSKLKSRYDSLLEAFGGMKGGEQIMRVKRSLQQDMARVSEALKMLNRSYTELQRGEIGRSSYLKVYKALRGEIREFISRITESEEILKGLTEKG